MRLDVPVQFNGTVSVVVPDHLSDSDARLLAEKLASGSHSRHLRQPRRPGGRRLRRLRRGVFRHRASDRRTGLGPV